MILTSENTQSAAEFQAMAFQTIPGAKVIGTNSAGADGNVTWIPLPFGYKTAFSGIGIYYLDMGETQRIGIVPDFYVKPTLDDLKKEKDKILDAAIDFILSAD